MVSESSAAGPPSRSLTSEPDRFSDDAWELLLASQDQARRWRHGAMDVEHLLQSLLLDPRFDRWTGPLASDRERLLDQLESFCAGQPTASGRELFIGDALEDLLELADAVRVSQGEALLEVSHLLQALRRSHASALLCWQRWHRWHRWHRHRQPPPFPPPFSPQRRCWNRSSRQNQQRPRRWSATAAI